MNPCGMISSALVKPGDPVSVELKNTEPCPLGRIRVMVVPRPWVLTVLPHLWWYCCSSDQHIVGLKHSVTALKFCGTNWMP